jgi:hypothetical protein
MQSPIKPNHAATLEIEVNKENLKMTNLLPHLSTTNNHK